MIAVYGGYFGGGMGIMMLAAFSVAGMADIHEMNGVKTLLAVAINGVALVEFIANGAIVVGARIDHGRRRHRGRLLSARFSRGESKTVRFVRSSS